MELRKKRQNTVRKKEKGFAEVGLTNSILQLGIKMSTLKQDNRLHKYKNKRVHPHAFQAQPTESKALFFTGEDEVNNKYKTL